MMLPGPRRIAGDLTRDYPGDRQDIDGEILLGFLEALHTIDPETRGIPGVLWWSAKRRGTSARNADLRARGYTLNDNHQLEARRATPVPGHPDLVLARAVSRGVVTVDEAELVGNTRLALEPLDQVARRLGLTYAACRKRRSRAEDRLIRFLGHPRVAASTDAALVAA